MATTLGGITFYPIQVAEKGSGRLTKSRVKGPSGAMFRADFRPTPPPSARVVSACPKPGPVD